MKRLEFRGYSDDTFCCITTGVDDDDCASGSLRVFRIHSKSEDASMDVCGQFAPKGSPGCWLIGIQADDERDGKQATWKAYFELYESSYSPSLVVEAPDDATVGLLGEKPS